MTSVTEEQATVEAAAPAEEQQAAKTSHDAPRNPKGGAQGTKGAPGKGKSGKKTTPAKKSPKGAKASKTTKAESGAPREGSKTGAVLELLRRKNGASLKEIMKSTGRQEHFW